MKIKTMNLEGEALDWAVAKCNGEEKCWGRSRLKPHDLHKGHSYSTDWSQSGKLIDLERICIEVGHDGVWLAYIKQNYEDAKEFVHSGSSALEAAMRTLVQSKLGPVVEVPDELMAAAPTARSGGLSL